MTTAGKSERRRGVPTSYLLCGTPRTGSTLLCGLLSSTGVAGRPESYFRHGDQRQWASRFGVTMTHDGMLDHRAFVAGAMRFGTTSNGVFAARVMWGSVAPLVDELHATRRARRDLDALEHAFGPLRLVHVVRENVVAQAVSWARAEQTGYWQRGDQPRRKPQLDLGQVDRLVRTITEHNSAWRSWFAVEASPALQITYEELVADPRHTVQRVLDHVGVHPPMGWTPEASTARQADDLNVDWERRYRAARGALAATPH